MYFNRIQQARKWGQGHFVGVQQQNNTMGQSLLLQNSSINSLQFTDLIFDFFDLLDTSSSASKRETSSMSSLLP